ncbi:hypothetical protein ABTY59_32225 [Streptomyces sp. NPDC096079]|uniref:hypothetical protein n=1 Tax=Streptomyces sp. NPDC096079 TaxID=3155820 RepID=UPI00331F3151
MSTTSSVAVQAPMTHVPPALPIDLTIDAYARSGTHLGRDVVDLHLMDMADKAACSLLRDQWTDHFPVAAYTELLTTIAALRSVLGFIPTPTATDVNAWARSVRDASAAVAGPDRDIHEVQIVEGPHQGARLGLWGPRAPQAPDTLVGPLLTLELITERGDSTDLEIGVARYRRLKQPHPGTGQWEYMLDRDHPFPAAGSRPHFLPSDQVGA